MIDLFKHNSELTLKTGPDGNICHANAIWRRLLGYSKEEAQNLHYSHILHPKEQTKCTRLFNRALSGKPIKPFQTVLLSKNLDEIHVIACLGLCVGQEQSRTVDFTFYDITSIVTNDMRLFQLGNVIRQAQVTVLVIDLDGNIVYVNSDFEKTSGYSSQEVVGKHAALLKSKAQPDTFYRELWSTITSGNTWQGVLINQRKDGSLYHEEGTVFPIRNEQNEITNYAVVKHDITERIKTQQELRLAKEKAEAAAHSRSEFLANMSHEIRTPLNAILGFTDILEKELADTAMKQHLSIIASSGKALLNLLNDILDLSKLDAGKFRLTYESVDLRCLFKELHRIFQWKAQEKNIAFVMDIDPELPSGLVLDETRIRQILINLIGNAIKFTLEGRVTVSVYKIFNQDRTKVKLVFSVQDTGIGIPENECEHIFKPFEQQTGLDTNKYGGTGLGLAITKRLVEMMRGQITVDSEVGVGSLFRVTFEEINVSANSPSNAATEELSIHLQPSAILLIDADAACRQNIHAFLSQYPVTIHETSQAEEALFLLSQHPVNLIMLDNETLCDQESDLLNVIQSREAWSGIPVIAMVSSPPTEQWQTLNAGYADVLSKPLKQKILLETLDKHLGAFKQKKEQMILFETEESKGQADKHQPGELIQVMLETMKPLWEELQKGLIINQAEDFGKQIQETGQIYRNSVLIDWGCRLVQQAQQFDVANLPETIREFEEILNSLTESAR